MKYYTGTWYISFYQFVHTYVLTNEVYSKDEVSNWVIKYSLCASDKIFPVSEKPGEACLFDHLSYPPYNLTEANSDEIIVLTTKHGFIIPESIRHGHIHLFVMRHQKMAGMRMGHT